MKVFLTTLLTAFSLAGLAHCHFVLSRPIRPAPDRLRKGLFLLGLTILVTAAILPFDRAILGFLRGLDSGFWKAFFIFWTRLADGLVLYPLLILTAWILSVFVSPVASRPPLLALIAGLSSGAVTQILKHLFLRARPRTGLGPWSWFHLERFAVSFTGNPNFISMPSGHTATIFAVCAVLAFAVRPRLAKVLLFLPAVLTAASRIHLNSHWPSDTIAAAGLGLLIGWFFTDVFGRTPNERSKA